MRKEGGEGGEGEERVSFNDWVDLCEYKDPHQGNEPLALDTETVGTTRDTNTCCYYSWSARDLGSGAAPITTPAAFAYLRELCASKRPKVMHNARFDLRVLEDLGFCVEGELHDTTLMHALLDEHHPSYHRLDALALEYLGHARIDELEIARLRKSLGWTTLFPQAPLHEYARKDAEDTLNLFYVFEPMVREQGLWELYRNEVDAALSYKAIEQRGIKIDLQALRSAIDSITVVIAQLQSQAWRELNRGREFNLRSPEQLSQVLKAAGFPLETKTPSTLFLPEGQAIYSTRKKSLEPHKGDPRMQLILAHKFLSKACSTLKGYEDRLSGGRVHPEYRQTTITGRSAAKDPPIQQIPKQRGRITEIEVGSAALAKKCADAFRSVRRVFIPADGALLISIDYSQIEYRAFVHYSGSERLIKAISGGEDFHTEICKMVFGDYNDRLRHITKMLNYGLLYGMGTETMVSQLFGEQLQMSPREVIRKYEENLPEMRRTQKTIEATGRARGYVVDVFGRRYRFVPEIGAYILVAWLCQGTAANIKKYALVRCQKVLEGKRSGIVADIHDELVFEIFPEDINLLGELRREMEDFPMFDVPIVVEIKQGPNLLDLKEVGAEVVTV